MCNYFSYIIKRIIKTMLRKRKLRIKNGKKKKKDWMRGPKIKIILIGPV